MKKIKEKKRFPVIDLGRCSECRGCLELAPGIFYYNEQIGRMDTADLDEYPEELIEEAIKNCPKDCIAWE